jgi:hypothetical protein
MTRHGASRALFALAAGIAVSLPARADSYARIVRLSFAEGQVQMDRRDGRGFEQAFKNMPLAQGTRLATGPDGRAEVEFEEGSTIRLVPNTSLEFPEMGTRSSGGKFTTVNMEQGQAYFNIRRKDGNEFLLQAAGQQIFLAHSSGFRVEVNQGSLKLAVFHGELNVSGAATPLTVKKNETLTLEPGDNRYFLARSVETGPYDAWNNERERYIDHYAYSNSYSSYSPYAYGASDLAYYGNFYTLAGYGPIWRPYYVSPYWNPFLDGAWVWYPGFGYTWVSAYPWGWLPFHYGNWIFVSNYGWCWRPGRFRSAWLPVAPVVNVPFWFHAPAPPPFRRGGPTVIAVGHGPQTIIPPGFHEPGSGHVGLQGELGNDPRRIGGGGRDFGRGSGDDATGGTAVTHSGGGTVPGQQFAGGGTPHPSPVAEPHPMPAFRPDPGVTPRPAPVAEPHPMPAFRPDPTITPRPAPVFEPHPMPAVHPSPVIEPRPMPSFAPAPARVIDPHPMPAVRPAPADRGGPRSQNFAPPAMHMAPSGFSGGTPSFHSSGSGFSHSGGSSSSHSGRVH